MSEGKVVVYVTQSCPYCHAAKDFLEKKKVRFEEIDVTGNDEAREKLVALSGGRLTVPQIFIDGKPIGGYDDLVRLDRQGLLGL